jgi:ornithine cyclodeaminase/alanine dehydrogenase-like protein (mu-crystallin family)
MTTNETIPNLSEEQLSGLGITTNEVIDSIESLISSFENQTAWSAPKAAILPEDGRYMMAALAAADDPPLLAVKTVVLNPRNPERGLPQINGLVTMLDSSSGIPIAILDGNWITAVRTAGLSATAAKHMARKDSSVAAFIGCGVEARSHLQGFSDLFPLKEIRLFGRGQTNIDSLCEDATSRSLTPVVCGSGEEAVTGADLVISSVTYSANLVPFLDANWLKPGSFSAITDLAAPWNKDSFSALDQITIDDLEQEAALPNKLAPPEFVTGDLSGLVLGKFVGRNQDSDRNAFIFRGHAMGDLALSVLAFQRSSIEIN